jgi:hypothetical protein
MITGRSRLSAARPQPRDTRTLRGDHLSLLRPWARVLPRYISSQMAESAWLSKSTPAWWCSIAAHR